MPYSKNYKGLIWTNHVLERLQQRKIPQDWAVSTFKSADSTQNGKQKGTTEFIKHIQNVTITLIGKRNEKKEWILVSCWVDPPLPGSIDIIKKKRYEEFKNASFLQRILLTFKYLLFPIK